MIVDELKKAILQYAIQGKLTKQLETDSNIEESLNNVSFKRNNFYNAGNRKKKIIVSNSAEVFPFEIPNNWCWKTISEVAVCIHAGGDKPKKFSTTKKDELIIPVIANGITNDGIIGYTDIATENEKCLTVSGRGTIGFAFVREEPFCPIVRLLVIKFSDDINIKYIKYCLNFLLETGVGTSIPQLTVPMLSPKLIPLPPKEEQQRIVERIEKLFSRLDELKDTEVKLNNLKNVFSEEMKQSILQCAIEGKLTNRLSSDTSIDKRFPNLNFYSNEGLFKIPNEWRWIRFKDLVDYSMGKTPPRKDPRYWGNDYSWISIADMVADGNITKTKEKVSQQAMNEVFKGRISKPGTLIMSFKLTVGKVSILDIEAFHNEAIISVYPKYDENNCIRNYLFKVLPVLVKYGDTKGAIKGKTLNSKSIDNLLIPLPPIEEQQRIVEKLDYILPLIESL